ncbi:septum formation initiator family protein [Candidatus Roizmanbacteria bacterium]|nr:septum formation initiator family protein [Candidatus Roizmanbacteria bacterium]
MRAVKTLLFSVLVVFLFFSLTKNLFDYKKTLDFYKSFQEEFEKEKKTNVSLKTKTLKNSAPSELEKTIRNKLNLLKKNELAIIIPKPTPTPAAVAAKPQPAYVQWWRLFFQN